VNWAKVLPLCIVMIAGPQILSAIFLATSENWRRNSFAYVFGALLSITLFVTIAYFFVDGVSEGSENDTVYWVVLGLLVFAAVHIYLTRKTAEPPKWMGKLQTASPKFSFRLGFLLLGIFPTDILTSVAVGATLNNGGDPWWHALPFIFLTLLLLALPSLLVVAMGERAQAFLPKVRDWMNANSWIVNECVIAIFIVLTINNLA
jgi:threonine/homoserine/homoserine lactone efflux protein